MAVAGLKRRIRLDRSKSDGSLGMLLDVDRLNVPGWNAKTGLPLDLAQALTIYLDYHL